MCVTPCRIAEYPILEALFDRYRDELSAYRDLPLSRKDADYRRNLESFITERGRAALFIQRQLDPVGFALVRPHAESPSPLELSALYVLPEVRCEGHATRAVRAVLSDSQEPWVLQVHARNTSAVAFWRSILPSVREEVALDAHDGERLQFSFHALNLAAG